MQLSIFEIIDKSSRKIHLTKERWSHITTKHSDMTDKIDEIINTLTKPTVIESHKFDDTMSNYYRYYKPEKCYLHVSVKYLNGEGFVATAFLTKKLLEDEQKYRN